MTTTNNSHRITAGVMLHAILEAIARGGKKKEKNNIRVSVRKGQDDSEGLR